jgi:hypothetical protein
MKRKTLITVIGIIAAVLVLIAVTALVAFRTPKNEDKTLNYISYDQDECVEILFTCPQYQKQFINDNGCGCALQTDKVDNPDARGLENLVRSYLAHKVFKPENEGGVVLAEFVAIGLEKSKKEVGKELKYETWAEIREYYYNAKDERTFNLMHRGPIVLEITETGKNYIIHGHELLDAGDKAILTEELSKTAVSWLNNPEAFKKTTDIIDQYIQQESDATLINNRIVIRKTGTGKTE